MKKIILILLTAAISWLFFEIATFAIIIQNQNVFYCIGKGKADPSMKISDFCEGMEHLQLYVPLTATAFTTFFVYKKLSNKKKPVQKK